MSAVNLLSSLREKPTDENPDDGSNPEGEDNVVSGGGGGDPAVLAVGPARKTLQYTRDQLMRLRNSPLVKRNLENAFANCEALALVLKRRSDSPNEEDRGARGDAPNENHKASGEQLRRLAETLKRRQSLPLPKDRKDRITTDGDRPFSQFYTNSDLNSACQPKIPLKSYLRGKSVDHPSGQLQSVHFDGSKIEGPNKVCENEELEILKKEHINRERRAEELQCLKVRLLKEKHELETKILSETVRLLKEKHELEMKILSETLKEARVKSMAAEKAAQDPVKDFYCY